MMKNQSLHLFVDGKVQGVFFRKFTKEKALEFGLTGWVKNLPDGKVEILACGKKDQLEKFLAAIKEGPTHAEIGKINIDWVNQLKEYSEFEILM